uniref:Uncharacterized protein LOC100185720 n=1 Tax=Phallusia mammillata TaxID=59560 RepID=A0A6F9DIC3_9ASCI|nr:uncharacterized protein LOC100185720 [Phallusia mammillata]
MWKESEFSSKRDDDSAIGDSPNNSAGEESINSRRKSSTSDDLEDERDLAFNNLNQKLGIKVPSCLLRNAEESPERCKSVNGITPTKSTKAKRVIKVLPANAVLAPKTDLEKQAARTKKSPSMDSNSGTEVFQAKLHHLLFEMKQLRELDSDILRKFVRLNDCIDDMRWQLEQREADLKRSMEQDDVITIQDDVMNDAGRPNPWEEDLKRLSEDENDNIEEDDDMKFVAPVTKATTSYATLTSVRSSKPGVTNKSYANPTHGHVDEKGTMTADRTKDQQEHSRQDFYRTKPLRPTSASQVAYTTYQKQQQQHPVQQTNYQPYHQHQRVVPNQRPASASNANKKYATRAVSFQSSGRDSAFRPIRSNQQSRDSATTSRDSNPRGDRVLVRRVSDFQKQRDYQNLIDLSRVRGSNQSGGGHPQHQQPQRPQMNVPGSRTSTSSIASSASSNSYASSLRSPTRPSVARSSSHKWARFGLGKSSKAPQPVVEAKPMAPPQSLVTQQQKRTSLSRRGNDVMIPRDQNVITVSYKRTTANDSVYSWIQSQDDVTYL